MIKPLYKPLGVSTHSFVQKQVDEGEKVTHTGSLDPAAEGLIVMLTGEDRYKKEELSSADKAYSVQMLVGIQTDSYDLLGLPTSSVELTDFPLERLEYHLNALLQDEIGEQEQQIPPFSAKRVNGESFFDIARRGKQVPLVYQSVELKRASVLDNTTISGQSVLERVQLVTDAIEGDFRQLEILKAWHDVLGHYRNWQFPLITIELITSKRFYVRQLIHEVGVQMELPSVVFSLKRTRHGEYDLDNN